MGAKKSNIENEILQEIGIRAEPVNNFRDDYKKQLADDFDYIYDDQELMGDNFEEQFKTLLIRDKQLDNKEKERALEWKQENMNKVYKLCIISLLFVFVIILLDGFNKIDDFVLPIKVMIAIIIGGVGNVLGLYYIVLNNLFPKRKKR